MTDKTQNENAQRIVKTKLNFEKIKSYFQSKASMRFYVSAAQCFLILFAFSQINFAQDDETEAPPPLKIISKEEKTQLDLEVKVKQRTKLSLELMEARLLKAETFSRNEDYRAMFPELGGFHALMEDALKFLGEGDSDSGKILNNFKRMEISLRKFLTRIELIRRDLPIKYEKYVRRLAIYVREARSRAVEQLFDDTVIPNNENNSNQ